MSVAKRTFGPSASSLVCRPHQRSELRLWVAHRGGPALSAESSSRCAKC